MVRPESAAVTPLSTRKTRLVPPASIVTPAAGPAIVTAPLVSLSSSCPDVRAIVCAVAKTVGSKVMVWGPPTKLVRPTAWRRLSSPGGERMP